VRDLRWLTASTSGQTRERCHGASRERKDVVLESKLQELLDRAAILKILHSYGRAIDRCDRDLLLSLFHDGATDDHGRFRGLAADLSTYAVGELSRRYDVTTHFLGNVHIDLQGDAAFTESYTLAFHIEKADALGQRRLDTLAIRYVDRFERRDDEWRIAERLTVKDWRHVGPCVEPIRSPETGPDRFLLGMMGHGDPSYWTFDRATHPRG
jgi:hypothetical protein